MTTLTEGPDVVRMAARRDEMEDLERQVRLRGWRYSTFHGAWVGVEVVVPWPLRSEGFADVVGELLPLREVRIIPNWGTGEPRLHRRGYGT